MKHLSIVIFSLMISSVFAQPKDRIEIDRVIAVVADEPIYFSDYQDQITQFKNQGQEIDKTFEAFVFEDMLAQKLMLYKARVDSVTVDEDQIESQIESRLQYIAGQVGSIEALEKHFGKTIEELKDDMREPMREQSLVQSAKWNIISDIKLTPGEIKTFYHSIPKDSLPEVGNQLQIGQLLKYPKPNKESISLTISKLDDFKQRILEGESFATLAILYSEDPGSSLQGGLYKGIKRGMFVKAFEDVMYSLSVGEISDPFKTEYGYHIVKLEARSGEVVDIRHILISPTIGQPQLDETKEALAKIKMAIEEEAINFSDACLEHSDDEQTKQNGGLMINPQTRTTFFETEELDPAIASVVENLELEEVSEPSYFKQEDGKEGYRILYVKSKKEKHILNLKDDYQYVQRMAEQSRQDTQIEAWQARTIPKIYIQIDEDFVSLPLSKNWKNQN
ncbi:MAG: peptidylprolyl isomerase [Flavobacteriales bacterium]